MNLGMGVEGKGSDWAEVGQKGFTCVARRPNCCDRQAVVLIDRVAKIAHLQKGLPLQMSRTLEQYVVQLDVPVDYPHPVSTQHASCQLAQV